MNRLLLILLFTLSVSISFSQDRDFVPGEHEDIFKVVEEMPRFPGCEHLSIIEEVKSCSEKLFLDYIHSNLVYPDKAKKNEIEGKVYIQFVVRKDGKLSDINIVRDIGGGCGKAAKDLLVKMNNEKVWIPGKQEGKPVAVLFTLPVLFEL